MMGYYILAILAVFFWSFNVIIGVWLRDVLLPWQIAFFRWFIAAAVLLPWTIKDLIRHRKTLWQNADLIFWVSLIGIAFSNTCVYYAAYTVSAVDMSLISVTGPVFLLLFSRLFDGFRLTGRQRLGLGLTIIGLFFVLLHGRFSRLSQLHFATGDLWMLGMAASFGLYSFLMSKKPRRIGQATLLSLTVFIGMLLTLPLFIPECYINPLTARNMTPEVVTVMLGLGIFNSVLAYLFWNISLNNLGNLRAGSLYYLMPVFSTLEARFILNEPVFVAQIFGGLVILIGIFLTNARRPDSLRFERP